MSPEPRKIEQRKMFWIRLAITMVALILLVGHLLRPELKIDAISLGLLIVALLPWFSSLIESVEFPGGWKVTLRDVEAAGRNVTGEAKVEEGPVLSPNRFAAPPIDAKIDANIALVALRIEIENRLRKLADKIGVDNQRPLITIFRDLQERDVIEGSVLSGLQELVAAGNQAAHGAKVEPAVGEWAEGYGPKVLAALDDAIQK